MSARRLRSVRRALRRAIKVSIGAAAGVIACAVVAVGGVDGAALLSKHPNLGMSVVAVAIAVLTVTAIIRRIQFVAPSARAQRVSMWIAAADDLADLELVLSLTAACHLIIAVT
nr:hypothetical protein [Deltaproteobacteria bacterium]